MPNKISANTYRTKKLVSPFMMGVERIQACPNLVCFASLYKNNARYCGGDNHGLAHGNKKARNSVASIDPADSTLGISE